MSDNPQPTPGRDTTVREKIDAVLDELKGDDDRQPYKKDLIVVHENDLRHAIEQLLIAEQTRLLNRLKAHSKDNTISKLYIDTEYLPVWVIDAELQQLRAGHGADGGEV